jgi:Zn finger protein HypA/HybF involved in hydrogenase expression
MNTEAEIYRILVQFWLKQITILEARQQLMDLFEAPKEMECSECGDYTTKGTIEFLCENCEWLKE